MPTHPKISISKLHNFLNRMRSVNFIFKILMHNPVSLYFNVTKLSSDFMVHFDEFA